MIPRVPDTLPAGFDRVAVRAFVDLSEAQVDAIRAAVRFDGEDSLAAFRENVTIGDVHCGFAGHIGVHDLRGVSSETEKDECALTLHYSFELEIGIRYKAKRGDRWESLSNAAADLLATAHPVSVTLSCVFPEDEIVPATALPIALGKSGVSGFSEIRGVRLAQPDPSDPSLDLYSVIVDRDQRHYYLTAATLIEASLNAELLTRALDRLRDVAALAYQEPRKP